MESNKEKEVLQASADLWNKFIELEASHPDDVIDFKFHIHALQRIIYTKIYIKENGQL